MLTSKLAVQFANELMLAPEARRTWEAERQKWASDAVHDRLTADRESAQLIGGNAFTDSHGK